MQLPSTLPNKSWKREASKRSVEEERATRADTDAAFELACWIIVMKSLPAWIDEICTEHV